MRKGFTLVELSIVLVIIGLLIGGILVAQSMIGTTKLQNLIRAIRQYEIATNNFKLNYRYYPGDDPYFTPPGAPDNQIGFGPAGVGINCNGIYYGGENYHVFAHLSQAKMLKPQYIPWTRASCGGTLSDNPADLGNIIGPYTELNAVGAAATGASRNLILPIKWNASSNFGFNFKVNTQDLLPLEAKLGSKPDDPSAIGLTNPWGASMCYYPDNDIGVACSDPNAAYGELNYYLTP